MNKTLLGLSVLILCICTGLIACTSKGTVSSISAKQESHLSETIHTENEENSTIQLQRAAGILNEGNSTQAPSVRLAVKNGVLYRGNSPVDSNITELNLYGLDFDDWSFLENFSQLESLNITTSDPTAYKMIQKLENLKTLLIEHYPGSTLDFLKANINLEQLVIANAPNLMDINDLCSLASLKDLELIDIPNEINTDDLSGWKNISLLKFSHFTISSVDFLSNCTNLETLALQSIDGIEDFSPIANCTNLSDLSIVFTSFTQIDILKNLKNLTSLAIIGTGMPSFKPVAEYKLPQLTYFLSDASEEDLSILKKAYPDCTFE